MKKTLFAAIAAICALSGNLSHTAQAQLDLGGAVSGAINGATGAAAGAAQSAGQAGAQAGAQLGGALPSSSVGGQAGVGAGLNAGSGLNAGAGANLNGGLSTPRSGSPSSGLSGSATSGLSGSTGSGSVSGGLNSGLSGGASGGLNSGLTSGASAGLNSGLGAGVQSGTSQGWVGRVGNDLRGAFQQADNGVMRLQGNVNSALQQYGFQTGDQLLGANGQPLTQAQFDQYLQSSPNQLRVLRNGQTITLGGNSSGMAQGGVNQAGLMQGSMSGRQRLGITMNASSNAVIVAAVTQGSPAATAGLRTGDRIVSVNGQQVQSPNDMIQLVNQADANQALDIQYQRGGQQMQSQVMLASMNMNRGGAYQAGYAQPMSGQQSGQNSGQGSAQLSADVTARIDQLERTVQELRDEVRRMSK